MKYKRFEMKEPNLAERICGAFFWAVAVGFMVFEAYLFVSVGLCALM